MGTPPEHGGRLWRGPVPVSVPPSLPESSADSPLGVVARLVRQVPARVVRRLPGGNLAERGLGRDLAEDSGGGRGCEDGGRPWTADDSGAGMAGDAGGDGGQLAGTADDSQRLGGRLWRGGRATLALAGTADDSGRETAATVAGTAGDPGGDGG